MVIALTTRMLLARPGLTKAEILLRKKDSGLWLFEDRFSTKRKTYADPSGRLTGIRRPVRFQLTQMWPPVGRTSRQTVTHQLLGGTRQLCYSTRFMSERRRKISSPRSLGCDQ